LDGIAGTVFAGPLHGRTGVRIFAFVAGEVFVLAKAFDAGITGAVVAVIAVSARPSAAIVATFQVGAFGNAGDFLINEVWEFEVNLAVLLVVGDVGGGVRKEVRQEFWEGIGGWDGLVSGQDIRDPVGPSGLLSLDRGIGNVLVLIVLYTAHGQKE
jgi:hypothetical protein